MKNLLKNKKGFTLAEILLVVAIIVVLSGATMIGIASMVNRSKATASIAQSKSADFEADAVLEVNKKKGLLAEGPVETETLETGNDTGTGSGDTGTGTGTGSGDTGTGTGTGDTGTGTGTGSGDTGTGTGTGDSDTGTGTGTGDTDTGTGDGDTGTGTGDTDTGTGTSSGTGFPRITSASAPNGIELSGSDSANPNNGGVSFKLTQDMTNHNKVTVTVTCNGNTFHHGWNLGNNAVVSNNGHTITYEMDFNPYYKDPFQKGAELHPQWEFNDKSGNHTDVTVSVVYS
jgi:prepilin-type N-terminal cleavage/methylation domain-containing protein